MTMSRPTRRTAQSGFTLLEMLISLALLFVLTGSILGGMASMQKNYRGNEISAALHGQLRASMEMMAQEIGQAGLPPSGMQSNALYTGSGAAGSIGKITQAVTAVGSQTVSFTPDGLTSVQTNQIVIVDSGASAELVMITAAIGTPITQITATFQKTHAINVLVFPQGIYPEGITFKTQPTLTGTYVISNQSLIMFGDITGTGMLSIVQYSCPTTATATVTDSSGVQWGPLIRAQWDYVGGAWPLLPSSSNMLDLVRVKTTVYPIAADGCRFDANTTVPPAQMWYMVTSVNVTLVAKSLRNDPQSNAPVVITKSFMNIQPRNILSAQNLYNYNLSMGLLDPYVEFNSTPSSVATQIGNLTQ